MTGSNSCSGINAVACKALGDGEHDISCETLGDRIDVIGCGAEGNGMDVVACKAIGDGEVMSSMWPSPSIELECSFSGDFQLIPDAEYSASVDSLLFMAICRPFTTLQETKERT